VLEQTAHALARGALHTLPTRSEFVEDGGIRFLVRVVSSLTRKDEARKEQDKSGAARGVTRKEANPFLPYDQDLFVADLSQTHVCLLNKFNVVEHHLLIVTRAFEDQECWLDLADFEALAICMAEFDGLGFYNGGQVAGASQRHKHLQMVPLPLAESGPKVPMAAVFASARFQGDLGVSSLLPFRHVFSRLDPVTLISPRDIAPVLLSRYQALLTAVGLQGEGTAQAGPYNLLVTHEWMLLVPRSAEFFHGISINGLGFAGALLVRDEQQMRRLKELGPMTALKRVAVYR
jgi:ATP adenylyltransferase